MTTDERIELWQYSELSPLGKKAVLVKNLTDGRLMVQYTCSASGFSLFEKLKTLKSPYLMKVYDCVVQDGKCISLCEYIEGVTLETAVEKRGVYSEYAVRNITAQLCDGLSVLHKAGIIHRDINPSNVMIDKNGVIKIIDYDIIRTVKQGKNSDTRILGTPGYAAPEQFGFTQTDRKADIYSCGVLINYLLTGEIPGEKLYFGNLTPIIKRCIEMDSSNRFNTAEELKIAVLSNNVKAESKKAKAKAYKNYRKLPGFRTGAAAKTITIILMIIYFIMLAAYINYTVNFFYDMPYPGGHILQGLELFVLLSALPYCMFGDIAGISHKLYPKNPPAAKLIMNIIGVLSIAAAVWLMFNVPLF